MSFALNKGAALIVTKCSRNTFAYMS